MCTSQWRHNCAMASQITGLTIVYSNVYSGADQRKHQSSTSQAFVQGIHGSPVNSAHKGPVTRKMFPFDDVIMIRGNVYTCTVSSLVKLYNHVQVSRSNKRPLTPMLQNIIKTTRSNWQISTNHDYQTFSVFTDQTPKYWQSRFFQIIFQFYGSVLVSWCAKNGHILTAPEHLLTAPEDL